MDLLGGVSSCNFGGKFAWFKKNRWTEVPTENAVHHTLDWKRTMFKLHMGVS